MELTTGAEVAGYSGHDLCARSRMLVSELRSPLAAVRMGAELLVRSDLSELQSQRVARNVLAATVRLEDILSDLALQLTDAADDEQRRCCAISVECRRGICVRVGS